MDMLPGQLGQAARQADPKEVEKALKQSEAIINSMTLKERRNPDILNASRRRRIAAGCRRGSAGREPADQAVPRDAEDDEDVPEERGKGIRKIVWVVIERVLVG